MAHPKRAQWEDRLDTVLRRVDEQLEAEYGDDYPLHPSRPAHGRTANPMYSGLFQVSAGFSAGYGSKHGRGYVVDVRMVTLERVPAEVRERIEADAADRIRQALPAAFPGRDLHVERDGAAIKIVGDLSLGEV